MPGGKIDFGEAPVTALNRERVEELGIDAIIGALIGVTSFVDVPSGIHWISPIYSVPSRTGAPCIQEPDKHDGLVWAAPNALPAPLMTPTLEALGFLAKQPALSLSQG